MKLLILLSFAATVLASSSDNPTVMEWVAQPADISGIKDCRKCSATYLALAPAEQRFWKFVLASLPDKKFHGDTIRPYFEKLNVLRRQGILDIASPPEFTGPSGHILKERFDAYVAYWNENYSPEQKDLLRHYYVDMGMTEEEAGDKIQQMSQDMVTTEGWKDYEKTVVGCAMRKKFSEVENDEVFITPINGREKVGNMVKRYLGMEVDNEQEWV